ncbi:MAG TPA: hypothetical protein VE861_08435, partial [Gemmatimonadaceae bacterium]|nr:hypothetical protein [Gemmatimonadaceae bacterium]
LLEFSVRALPVAYAHVHASPGTHVVLDVTGPTAAQYTVAREEDSWRVHRGASSNPACVMAVDADHAWRLLYNACDPERARQVVQITGDAALAEPLLGARSVIV